MFNNTKASTPKTQQSKALCFRGAMGPLTEKIIAEMDELSSLLESVGEESWSNTIKKARSFLAASNYRGIDEAKTWFGTIGTLNDLIIHPVNGHQVLDENLDQVNSRLRELSGNIYHLVQDIERNTSFE